MMEADEKDYKRFCKGIGRKEYFRFLREEKLTPLQAILAKCYECMGYYEGGTCDCKIPDCPLYPFMPYRKDD